jgi:hypothetical protein
MFFNLKRVLLVHLRPFLFFAIPDAELNIDMLDGFAKVMRKLHPKPKGLYLTCFCDDSCKMEVGL